MGGGREQIHDDITGSGSCLQDMKRKYTNLHKFAKLNIYNVLSFQR